MILTVFTTKESCKQKQQSPRCCCLMVQAEQRTVKYLQHVKQILQLLCVSSWLLPPQDAYRAWHHSRTNTLISSHHLTPRLHLGSPDMAFSVTPDQVGSFHSTKGSHTTERFHFLLLGIKLYEDCQRLFDSALKSKWKSTGMISACVV